MAAEFLSGSPLDSEYLLPVFLLQKPLITSVFFFLANTGIVKLFVSNGKFLGRFAGYSDNGSLAAEALYMTV